MSRPEHMIHPVPAGTRDVLPEEMRELRRLHRDLMEVFEEHGYGEVRTPAIEFDDVMAEGGDRTAASAYRLFGEDGQLLALRSDMTVPIARMTASRFADAEPPFRFAYLANALRSVRPQSGQMRESMQAGVELIGLGPPEGTTEVVAVLAAALDSIGLDRAVIGLGDADLYPQLLDEYEIRGESREVILDCLERHDLVGLENALDGWARGSGSPREALLALPKLRGGIEVLDRADELGGDAVAGAVARVRQAQQGIRDRGLGDRVMLDLGLTRDLDYYTGAVLEVYDPALGHILGGGGRYDTLLSNFGLDLPAAGFSLYVERLQFARAAAGGGGA